ncbi:phosphodiesterase [Agromyces sp. Root1464]|uniref:phosphodiesterase n=1 Tax=Agromyces sp. Root1464 TaxID=1736467 RepID=UPI001F358C68|nr:phosphodiesterase [Agromyces sp. Root1464]
MTSRTAEYPRPDHFLLHISDTHVLAGGGKLYDRVESERHLQTLFEEFEASGGRPEAIVFTGDLADKGEPDAYDRIRGIVDPVAERLGAQVIWVMGNHDERAAFRRGLLGERGVSAERGGRPVDRVDDVGGLRVITLDSTVPGHHHGEIAPEQLDWLAEELSMPAPHGTILAMHHPPVPSVLDLAAAVELRDQGGLAEVVEGSDIRSIIAGHLHYSSTATFAGVPVSVASASCYTQDLNVPVGGTRGRDGARAFNLVHVYPNTVLHSVVPLGSYAALDWIDAEESSRRLAASGIGFADAATPPVPKDPPFTMPIPVLAG